MKGTGIHQIRRPPLDSKQTFSGEELKQLYKDGQFTDDLQTHENLKKLLNYELDVMGDTIDSNFNFEIIDFCIAKIKEMESMDEQKLNYLGDKISSEAKETERKENPQRSIKTAAKLTVVGFVACALIFTGQEGLAGKFDLVHRLIWQDKGEQLSMKTPDMTLSQIEMEDGHLPDEMPDGFSYVDSEKIVSGSLVKYQYKFVNTDNKELLVYIKDYKNNQTVFDNEIEITKNSSTLKLINNKKYYYNSNYHLNSISWANNKNIITISGDFEFEILEDILSLYMEEEE